MATATPSHNPQIGRTSSGGGDGDSSDEVSSHPPGTPPALVEPVSYPMLGAGISMTVTAGKPRLVFQLGGANRGGYGPWFPDLLSWGHSGKLIIWAMMMADTAEAIT